MSRDVILGLDHAEVGQRAARHYSGLNKHMHGANTFR